MNYEEIEKLDKIISKRLGKKANALWQKAKIDLKVPIVLRNHITRVLKFETPKEIKLSTDYSPGWVSYWYEYVSQKLEEEGVIFITNWIKENIDKESLRRWLEE